MCNNHWKNIILNVMKTFSSGRLTKTAIISFIVSYRIFFLKLDLLFSELFTRLYILLYWSHTCVMYYKTKKSTSHRYFDACFIHNIGGVSDRR